MEELKKDNKNIKKNKEFIEKIFNNKYFVALLILAAPFLFILVLKFTYAYIPGEEVGKPKDWISFAGGYLGVIGAVGTVWWQMSTQLKQKEKETVRKEALKKLGIINFSIIFFEDIKNYLSDSENGQSRLIKPLLMTVDKKVELVESFERKNIKKISFFDEDLRNIFLNNFNLIFDEAFVEKLIFSYKKVDYFEKNYNKNLYEAKNHISTHLQLISFEEYWCGLECFKYFYKNNKKDSEGYLNEVIKFLDEFNFKKNKEFAKADIFELSVYYKNLNLLLFGINKDEIKISNLDVTIDCVKDLLKDLNRKKEEF